MKINVRAWSMIALSMFFGMSATMAVTGCQDSRPVAERKPAEKKTSKKDDKKKEDKPEVKPEDKPDVKPEDKPEMKPEDKPEDQVAVADVKPADGKSAMETAMDPKANAPIKEGDWSQWAGTSYRNNTPIGKNVPTYWDIGGFDRKTGEWKKDDAENILWIATLGSQTYGNPVVSNGRIFVGTNNGSGYLKRYPSDVDLGCLVCFDEKTGKFLWQASHEKLSTGRVHDWPLQGICCAPYVEGDRLWYVTSRGHVACLDTAGFHDDKDNGVTGLSINLLSIRQSDDAEKDLVAPALAALAEGKITPELRDQFEAAGTTLPMEPKVEADGKAFKMTATVDGHEREFKLMAAGPFLKVTKLLTTADKEEADLIWTFDMMGPELGVSQHNMCSCSITAYGDIIFVNTSNGLDESHINLPAPDAPSFIAMDKNTGKVLWTDKSPGTNILHGQWSSPTVAEIHGVPQVIYPGGDGWIYSFKANEGKDGSPELLWKFDANPKDSKWVLGGRGTRNNLIGTPVVYNGLVYIAVGQDPEHGEGVGHLWCLRADLRGDISPQLAVKVEDRKTVIPPKRIQAVNEEEGEVAIDNPNSGVLWHYSEFDQDGDGKMGFEETMHRSCSTVTIKDDLLFTADFSGLLHCLDAKTGKPHWTYDMLAACWGSPLVVDGHVYIGDEDGDVSVFEAKAEPHDPIEEIYMDNSVYSTPVWANGVLYIANKTHLFAIGEKSEEAAEAKPE